MPTPLIELLQTWSSYLPTSVSVVVCAYIWWQVRKERKAVEERAQALENEIAARLDRIEIQHAEMTASLHGLPSLKDLGPIYDRINATNSELQRLVGQITGINRHIDMLTEHHLRD